MGYILAPSILSADFNILGAQMKRTEEMGAGYLHFDVMDGMFVPNISFGIPVLASIKNTTGQTKDVHLMVQEPVRYVEDFAAAGADIITVHLEACEDIKSTIAKIRECGIRAGVSICPDTPVAALSPLLGDVDMALVMSVYPGFGGQKFMTDSLDRIRKLKAMIEERKASIDIEVDGGITLENVRSVLDAGANVIVAGSSVFNGDPGLNTREFMEMMASYE